jgi:hypothetical protein
MNPAATRNQALTQTSNKNSNEQGPPRRKSRVARDKKIFIAMRKMWHMVNEGVADVVVSLVFTVVMIFVSSVLFRFSVSSTSQKRIKYSQALTLAAVTGAVYFILDRFTIWSTFGLGQAIVYALIAQLVGLIVIKSWLKFLKNAIAVWTLWTALYVVCLFVLLFVFAFSVGPIIYVLLGASP